MLPVAVELTEVTRRFGGFTALAGVSLQVRRGEFFSLLGPSGCGKTTLLRLIAGLDLPDAGSLHIGGRGMEAVPAHLRPVNTVFQSYALFPHLSVRENVAFGLRMKKVPPAETDRRVARVMELVEIAGMASRRPAQLSGGQKQRVALARALVNEPEVLLLDEPLGALDLKLRQQLQIELRALQKRLGLTFIYVTHDQDEALVMSDRIGVMNAGRIEQLGDARELYERPRTRFVADFLGQCNLLEGVVTRIEIGPTPRLQLQTALGEIIVAAPAHRRAVGERCTLALRPEKVALVATPGPGGNAFRVRVSEVVYTGADSAYSLTGGVSLKARQLNGGSGTPGWKVGDAAFAQFDPTAPVLLED